MPNHCQANEKAQYRTLSQTGSVPRQDLTVFGIRGFEHGINLEK